MTESPSQTTDAIARTRDEVLRNGVFLCLRFAEADRTVEAARAAARGGLRVLEITLTTPGALEAIAELSRDDGLIVGAGTVLDPGSALAVAQAGGRFAMSPVLQPEVIRVAHQHGLLAVPGAGTATEILIAHRAGADLVKVFPVGALGGPGLLKALGGPLPGIPLVPTSGPTAANLAEYVAAGAVAVGIGSEVFPEGFEIEDVEPAARRVREAMDRARKAIAA